MARWEPGARDRLERAAMELYVERGFEQTTVAEIAARAGLTERTFFRHFADKREVLFSGQARFEEIVVDAMTTAPATAPLDVVTAGLEALSPLFRDVVGLERARHRQGVITANPELRERELIKLARLAAAMAEALRARGVPDPSAGLAAETGLAVFRVSFERWISDDEDRDLAEHVHASLRELRAMAAAV